MKKIAKITTQKRKKDRYNIYLTDGEKEEYAFSVDEAILVKYHLRKGLELDEEMILTLQKQDSIQKSYGMAINYLSYRMRTEKEMRDYLLKKEVEPEHIKVIMERLIKEKLIDDKLFSEMFVRTRINTSTKGPLLIKKELIEKGVHPMIADEAVEIYTFELQYEKIKKLLEKRNTSNKRDSYKKQLQKIQASLLQKGFNQSVIMECLSEYENEQGNEAEWEALCFQGEKLLRKYQKKYEGFILKQKMKEALYRKGFQLDDISRYLDEYMEVE